nr:GWxTD domain-containing protein [Saprospiraceae bacterium]
MNKIVVFILSLLVIFFPTSLESIEVDVTVYSFNTEDGSYAEINIYIEGNSLTRVGVDSINSQSTAEIFLLVTDESDSSVIYGDRFLLRGPASSIPEDFLELKRFGISDGNYRVHYNILDSNDSLNFTSGQVNFSVIFNQKSIAFSDIQLLVSAEPDTNRDSRFVKSGYRMEMAPYSFFAPDVNQMAVYFEIYGLRDLFPADDFYALGYQVYRRGHKEPEIQAFRRRNVVERDLLLLRLNLEELGSGEYFFKVGVYNRNQELLAYEQTPFYRYNPQIDIQVVEEKVRTIDNSFVQDLNKEELIYSLKAIAPLVDARDISRLNNILDKAVDSEMRHFLYEKWCNIEPYQPEMAYSNYMEVARAVDRMFYSGFGHGFETDKGRVYLKYGRPDNMESVMVENDAPPYTIWSYNRLHNTGQTDVKFVFYNPSLAGNMYELLHTNARGELNNPRWMLDLYSNDPNIYDGPNPQESRNIKDGFNRRAMDFFRDQ